MEFKNQEVWTGVEDLNNPKAYQEMASQGEFTLPETLQDENKGSFVATRRDFLKYLGFGVGAATVAASCEIPVKRAVPFVVRPDSIVPGVANYYASSFVKGGDYCSILVKTREGRPIKIEGNGLSPVTLGGTSARAQASVLDVYDYNRVQTAGRIKGERVEKMAWADFDKEIVAKLNPQSRVAIISNTILSPTTKKAIADFKVKFPNTKEVIYDPISSAALLEANQESFGERAIANYAFDKAEVIVSFGADFLGTWISPIEYAAQYAKGRRVREVKDAKMSFHVQVESYMSLTGSNADNRVLVKPSEMGAAIANLYVALGGSGVTEQKLNGKANNALKKVAEKLLAAKGKSLVVSGSNNVGEQVLVNAINALLGNVGATVSFAGASLQRQGDERQVSQFMTEGADVVLVLNANPVFELPFGDKVAEAIKKAPLSVSFNALLDETGSACQYAAPANHFLESWGDAEPKRGHYSLIQPTIAPVFDTRQAEQTLLTWAGVCPQTEQPMYDYVQSVWQEMAKQQKSYITFQAFWDATLHDGVFNVPQSGGAPVFKGNIATAADGISKYNEKGQEVTFFETVNMGNGQYANNPWLQELPDPVTRTVWTNAFSLPLKWNGKKAQTVNDLNDGDKINVKAAGKEVEGVIVRQFGQPENTTAIALGYGRDKGGYCGTKVGTNVQKMLPLSNGLVQYYAVVESMSGKTGTDDHFACVQYHHSMGLTNGTKTKDVLGKDVPFYVDEEELGYQGTLVPRTVVRRTNLKDLKKFAAENKEKREEYEKLNRYTLYRGHQDLYKRGHHWGMNIDLTACIGCGACAIACMSENNVPVVGKYEVHRHHEMTWLRIDRYFYGDVENPNTVYQPLMCQHCDNAPCENVCPVNASSHSAEGINQMAYNRCIGTRYCANNCPFKVRRFNWLDYTTADLFPMNERDLRGATLGLNGEMPYGADNLTRMVLNPDVTVRSRGVIEKCSLCVQRIQDGKLTAKREERQLRDGDIKTACQSACPTGAIVFGDQNNPESEVVKLNTGELNFIMLEEINVRPNMTYGIKINNRDEDVAKG